MAPSNKMGGSADMVRELIAAAEPLTQNNIGRYLRGLPFKARLALRAALHLPKGTLTIRLPDRRSVKIDGYAPGPEGIVILHNWNIARKALSGGTIGVAESYVDGDWESPDVTSFLELFVVNEELGTRLATAGASVKLLSRVRHWFNRNTKTRARKNIAAHYDLGNDFYALWLDPSMTYSSALYQTGANDLESAQNAKYRALAEAAGITGDDHVLEIGCGWGGFAEFAAREIGCRVTGLTISREQLDFARQRMRLAGLSDRVTIKFQDYRDETERYDKVVSIEMFEAVGEAYWETYFAKVRDVLKPGGKASLQIITIDENAFPIYRKQPDFIQRYVFPGGMLPPPPALRDLGGRHALELIGERVFPQDYARTLAEWRDRFRQRWPQIGAMGFDERFKRLWEFYLHYCEAGFRAEFIDVRQLTFARNA